MAAFAGLYGAILAYRALGWQADGLSDILKSTLVITIATAVLAFIFWSLSSWKTESKMRGMMAGLLTAAFVIPTPAFLWSVKTEVLRNLEAGHLWPNIISIITSTFDVLGYSFSAAEFLALPMSAIVGFFIAKG